jgi:hypothetical protein
MTVVLVIVPLGGLLLLLYGAGRLAIASGARLPWTPRRSGRHFGTARALATTEIRSDPLGGPR